MDELGHKRAKKGKKVPAAQIRSMLKEQRCTKVALEGASGIGKTALLQLLATQDYQVEIAPQAYSTDQFVDEMFGTLCERWKELQQQPTTIVIEGSPWGYFFRFQDGLASAQRVECR